MALYAAVFQNMVVGMNKKRYAVFPRGLIQNENDLFYILNSLGCEIDSEIHKLGKNAMTVKHILSIEEIYCKELEMILSRFNIDFRLQED